MGIERFYFSHDFTTQPFSILCLANKSLLLCIYLDCNVIML